MKVLDLFSGIGGFSLGLERAGMETVGFCEIDPFCRKVLKKHWPSVPIHDDIKTLKGDEFGQIDLICGGYPCQPFSCAGKRQGDKDDRHLWPEMLRIIKQARPAWVVAENTPGHITMGLDAVLLDLESEGYTWRPLIIPACAVDARQIRHRVWIVASLSGRRCGIEKEREIQQPGRTKTIGTSENMATTTPGDDGGSNSRKAKRQAHELRKSACRSWRPWLSESGVGRVVHGVPDRVDRIRALGNAVVPRIPETIGRAIMESNR